MRQATTVYIEEATKKQYQKFAIDNGISMSDIVNELFNQYCLQLSGYIILDRSKLKKICGVNTKKKKK